MVGERGWEKMMAGVDEIGVERFMFSEGFLG